MRLFPFASCTLHHPFRPLGVTFLAHPLSLVSFPSSFIPSLFLSFSDLYLLYTPRIVLTPFAPFPLFSPSSLLSAHTALHTRSPSNFSTLSFPRHSNLAPVEGSSPASVFFFVITPLSFHRLAFPHLFRCLPPFAADPPSRPQCRRTRCSPKKKREEKPAQVRSSTLSCARRSMDLCSFRDSCDRPNDPNISAAAATAARRAAPRVIYASTSIGVDEVERPSRTREGEGERKRKRENKRSDRAQAGLTLHSSRLDFRL